MLLSSFDPSMLSPAFADLSEGEAFQQLAFQLLRCRPEYTSLREYTTPGVDGCIDLEQVIHGERTVVECKKIGKDGIERAKAYWKDVFAKLERNLEPTDAPKLAQFQPWYDDTPPIRAYVYCISSTLANPAQRGKLRRQIAADIERLAERPHLAHLAGLEVRIIHWPDLDEIL